LCFVHALEAAAAAADLGQSKSLMCCIHCCVSVSEQPDMTRLAAFPSIEKAK
jgi:hypothetical protein